MWVNVLNQTQHHAGIIDKSDDSDWACTDPIMHKGYVLMNREMNARELTEDDYKFMIGDGTDKSYNPDIIPVEYLNNAGWTHLVITADAGTAAYPQYKVYKNGAFLTVMNRLNVGNIDTTDNLVS